MPIKTTRSQENGRITIDYGKCTGCGICVDVCKDLSLILEDKKLKVNPNPIFGCVACGQCVAVCPSGAITVEGRDLSKSDSLEKPRKSRCASFDQLYSLLLSRRSVRNFKDQPVEKELIEKVIQTSSTAPMGIPPSGVRLLVLNGKEKVREFSFDFIDFLKSQRFIYNPFVVGLMRPFLKKEDYDAFKTFIIPMIDFFVGRREKDENWLLYDAPLAIFYYGVWTDPADPYIAATYGMLAAESLGLGSCMIGSMAPFLKYGGKRFKQKYGIDLRAKEGIVVIFGHPKYKYHKAIRRTFEKVHFY